MSSSNDELVKRIIEDDPFSASGPEYVRKAVVRQFDTAHKKVLFRTLLWVLLAALLIASGLIQLARADDVRVMFLAAVIILAGFELNVLIKLWYWVVNTKIAVMKELKKVQILTLGESLTEETPPHVGSSLDLSEEGGGFWDRITFARLRLIVQVVLGALAVALAVILIPLARDLGSHWPEYVTHMTIAEDGSANVAGRFSYVYHGVTPLYAMDIFNVTPLVEPAWRTEDGEAMSHEVSQDEHGYHYAVRFPTPVFNGDPVAYRTTARTSAAKETQPGVWTHTNSRTWGGRQNYVETITLPPGATVVHVSPKPNMQFTRGGRTTVCFEGRKKRGDTDDMRVEYRLAPGE